MAKKAFIISAVLITIIIIVSIIISISNLKQTEFRSVVSYDNNNTVMVSANSNTNNTGLENDLPLFSKILKFEKTIMVSSLIVVALFTLIFYGAKRSKS